MARSVEDLAILYGVLSATSAAPCTTPSFAVASNWRTANPETDRLFDDVVVAMKQRGLHVSDREFAVPGEREQHDELTVMLAELVDNMSTYLSQRPARECRHSPT